jgi:MFS family permease
MRTRSVWTPTANGWCACSFNAITFGFAQIMSTYFHVTSSPGYYFAVIAAGNLAGPLLLGRLFDTVGRRPMISGCYIISGVLLFGTAALFVNHMLTAFTVTACWSAVLFFASADASSAYLTVSEVFPMETRALAIAFFYALGTRYRGIPLGHSSVRPERRSAVLPVNGGLRA